MRSFIKGLLILQLFGLTAVALATQITDLTFSQSVDGSKLAHVDYTLTGDSCNVELDLSLDDGATWQRVTDLCDLDAGPGIAPGNRHIVVDLEGFGAASTANARFRIEATTLGEFHFLGPPAPSISTLMLDHDNDVHFTVAIDASEQALMQSVLLHVVDGAGQPLELVGELFDDGDLAHGDEILGDGLYSMITTLHPVAEEPIRVRVVGLALIDGEPQSRMSAVTILDVAGEVPVEFAQTVEETQGNASLAFDDFQQEHGTEQALQMTIELLESQEIVSSAVVSPSGDIVITYSNGLLGMIMMVEDGVFGGPSTQSRRGGPGIPPSRQTVGSWTPSVETNLSREAIGSNQVMIYSPLHEELVGMGINYEDDLVGMMDEIECPSYTIEYLVDNEADVAAFNHLSDYGLVVIRTHGGLVSDDESFFCSGEVFSVFSPLLAQWVLQRVFPLTPAGSDVGWWAIRPSYISSRSGTMAGSIVYNASCHSAQNDAIPNAFLGKGASAYFGYSETVGMLFETEVGSELLQEVISGESTIDAFLAGQTDPGFAHAEFLMLPTTADQEFASNLVNAGFEEGSLTGWSTAGDGRVISQLAFLEPTAGSYMGIISTGLGYSDNSGQIEQNVCIPEAATELRFNWNFLSEEFLEYIGSVYQDFFTIVLTDQDGEEHVLFYIHIDSIAEEHALTLVSPNIVFDQGDVYMTGWLPQVLDLSAFAGQSVTLRFQTGDVGDSIYDSAVLIDEIDIE